MKTNYSAIIEEAKAPGVDALAACWPIPMAVIEADCLTGKPKPGAIPEVVSEGMCGFAWIAFPGNTAFGRWMKLNKYASKHYPSGLCWWISAGGQSIERKEAYARAACAVLRKHGIEKVYVGSRLD